MLKLTEIIRKGNSLAIALQGELTFASLPDVFSNLKDLFMENTQLAIDLSGITRIDSAGIQLLCALKRTASAKNKNVKFFNHSPSVIDLLEIYGLVGLFKDKIIINAQERGARFRYGTEVQNF